MAESIRGVQVHLPTDRQAADGQRPIRITVAGVAYADLNPEEAGGIADSLSYYAEALKSKERTDNEGEML